MPRTPRGVPSRTWSTADASRPGRPLTLSRATADRVCRTVGIPEGSDAATITAAVMEAVEETRSGAPGVPAGHVAISEGEFAELQAAAREGFLQEHSNKIDPSAHDWWADAYDRDPVAASALVERFVDSTAWYLQPVATQVADQQLETAQEILESPAMRGWSLGQP